jgi:hypothetical protein
MQIDSIFFLLLSIRLKSDNLKIANEDAKRHKIILEGINNLKLKCVVIKFY